MARVLILGASSAIASAVAWRWAARGDELVLLARDPGKLDAAIGRLGPRLVACAAMDVEDVEGMRAAIDHSLREFGPFDRVLVAHGWLGDQRVSERDPELARRILDINFVSVVDMLTAIAPHLRRRANAGRRPVLAVITSVAGERGRPRNFSYGAAKGGLAIYLQGLRSTLWPHVQVTTLKLGPVDTPMTVDHAKNFSFSSIDQVADGIVAAIDAGRAEAFVPGWWAWVMAVVRWLPEPVFQRLKFLSGR